MSRSWLETHATMMREQAIGNLMAAQQGHFSRPETLLGSAAICMVAWWDSINEMKNFCEEN